MQLREMIDKYPQQYIAVAYTKKGIDNLSEIKAYKKRDSDFDIVYGDYED